MPGLRRRDDDEETPAGEAYPSALFIEHRVWLTILYASQIEHSDKTKEYFVYTRDQI